MASREEMMEAARRGATVPLTNRGGGGPASTTGSPAPRTDRPSAVRPGPTPAATVASVTADDPATDDEGSGVTPPSSPPPATPVATPAPDPSTDNGSEEGDPATAPAAAAAPEPDPASVPASAPAGDDPDPSAPAPTAGRAPAHVAFPGLTEDTALALIDALKENTAVRERDHETVERLAGLLGTHGTHLEGLTNIGPHVQTLATNLTGERFNQLQALAEKLDQVQAFRTDLQRTLDLLENIRTVTGDLSRMLPQLRQLEQLAEDVQTKLTEDRTLLRQVNDTRGNLVDLLAKVEDAMNRMSGTADALTRGSTNALKLTTSIDGLTVVISELREHIAHSLHEAVSGGHGAPHGGGHTGPGYGDPFARPAGGGDPSGRYGGPGEPRMPY